MRDRDNKLARLGFLYYDKLDQIEKLHRLLGKYDRLQELLCNGRGWWAGYDVQEYDLDNDEPSPLRIAEQKVEDKIKALVSQIDSSLTVDFQGGPRGYCVRIYTKHALGDGRNIPDCISWLFYY